MKHEHQPDRISPWKQPLAVCLALALSGATFAQTHQAAKAPVEISTSDMQLQLVAGSHAPQLVSITGSNQTPVSYTHLFQVESIQDLPLPQELNETVEASIDRALSERPDLMQQVAVLRAAKSEVKSAKTAYLPTLSIDGNAGLAKTYGSQDQAPGIYSQNQEFWNARCV